MSWRWLLVTTVVSAQYERFPSLVKPPADPILGLKALYVADEASEKMEFTIGAYRTDDGKPWVLPSVAEATARVVNENHEYLPIEGYGPFLRGSEQLLYGIYNYSSVIASVQALSGTGAVRLALEFLQRHWPQKTVLLPGTTWSNHKNIVRDAGYEDVKTYRYLKENKFDIHGLLEDLRAAPEKSIVLFHLCAHNPSGIDPSMKEWNQIANVVFEKNLLPLFDSAYLGFATGDVDNDARPFRLFVDRGLQPWAAVSFSKNFGLYSERVGAVHATMETKDERDAVIGHFKLLSRAMFSNPPAFGARIVAEILHDADLKARWLRDLKIMADRITAMRSLLKAKLEELGGDWSHITSQIGMFSFTGLTRDQVLKLRSKHHIYLLENGRLSMAGVNTQNVNRLALAIADVLESNDEL